MEKPKLQTVHVLDFFDCCDYLKSQGYSDADDIITAYCEPRNDSYFIFPLPPDVEQTDTNLYHIGKAIKDMWNIQSSSIIFWICW